MKGLANKLTEDNLIIKNYVIVPSSEKFATHTLFSLPKELCLELTEKMDQGQRYALGSRYIYSCNGTDNVKGIRFESPIGAVQRAIWKHFGDVKYLKIIKFQENEKNNSVLKESVDQI